MKLSTISAAITAPITLAYASQYTVENYVLYGAQDSTGAYPNYAQSIIVGSEPIKITNPMVVFSISATNQPQHYACTFTGAEGTNTTVYGTVDVDPPQAQVSLHCSGEYIA